MDEKRLWNKLFEHTIEDCKYAQDYFVRAFGVEIRSSNPMYRCTRTGRECKKICSKFELKEELE